MTNLRNHSITRGVNEFRVCSLTPSSDMCLRVVRLHTHLRAPTETIEGYPSEYCAVFYTDIFQDVNRYPEWYRDLNHSPSLVGGNTNSVNISCKTDYLNETMFIGVINISKKGQRSIPCLIRLQALNSCPLNITQSFDGVPGSISFETVFSITDREEDNPVKRGFIEKPELPEEVVKCRPKVVTSIANKQRNISGNVFHLLKPEHALSCLSILEPLNEVVNDLEVVLCSAEFEERAVQRMHMLSPVNKAM